MSIEPITINIKETSKTKESRDKNSRQVLINSKKYEEISKKKLCFIKSVHTFLSSILVFLQGAFVRVLRVQGWRKAKCKSQLQVFESSMKCFIVIGKYLGLFPILEKAPKKRYPFLSWRYAFSFIICLAELVAVIFCFIGILKTSINISKLSYLSFYGTTFLSSLLVMRLATKWHELVKQVEYADLNEYIDPYIQFKCNIATVVFFTFAVLDHVLSNIPKYLTALDCLTGKNTVYEQYIMRAYSWIFEIGVPYALPLGIILPILNMIVAVNWSYSHIFVICVSLYLSSIIKQINKKIISSDGRYLSASCWRALRQDYNKATRLVHCFDDIVNNIVFASFASNLFFVCLQIYYVLRIYHMYQQIFVNTYFVYSSIFVIIRTFIVSTIAAKVHSASLEIAPVLYNVPSASYCVEVQRFIEQIHGEKVALTGLNFFYVTKELVLSMIGTIVTYELVLLQFN